ncbi:hypothetical protein G9464_06015 [Halostella sp. JP-L12]|uniref:hypothetical protein n=1 Tax=Halostella TaxID=1843185 RepID=UPI000EF7E4CB|nr:MULTISPECIES: hypothetical protein [Halostella]NHN47154.1 hypothetical protein [Halostella sp. JP-L12]
MVTLTTSTVITGLFLVAVIAATVVSSRRAASDGGRRSRAETAAGRSEHYVPGEHLVAALRGELAAWIAGFLLLAVGFGGATVLALGDPTLLGGMTALFVALLVLYLLAGVYLLGRQRGHSTALAVAESATAFGVALIVGVLFRLVTG